MKIWRLSYYEQETGRNLSWHPSKSAAFAEVRRLKAMPEEIANNLTSFDVKECIVPSSKKGLIKWLNIYLTRDNG